MNGSRAVTSTSPYESPVIAAPAPSRRDRLALRVMQAGVVAIVLAVSTFFSFELDRFFVPKELTLHLTAVIAGLLLARSFRDVHLTRTDMLLIATLLLGLVSAAFATNLWVAMRSIAMTASGIVIFWSARTLRAKGLATELIHALALGLVLVAATSLLQTYGVETTLFSENRAPGGTLGNRNFVAHAGAFGLPVILLSAVRARRTATFLAGASGVMLVVSSLVLTRSRGAWLAFVAVLVVFAFAMLVSTPLRANAATWRRLAAMAFLAGLGVTAVLLLPNTLRWRSDNPYMDSVESIADYEEGSGRGRLIQYERSLMMAARNPVLGVGPGNWPVRYPRYAARNDPSLSTSDAGTTFNPWPSSDWIAWISERGFAAALVLALTFAAIAIHAFRQLYRAQDLDHGLEAAALLATIVGALVAGAFDAVLLLALPALLIWSAIGALWQGELARARPRPEFAQLAMLCLVVISVAGAARSAAQLVAMGVYENRSDRSSMVIASRIDPGNYRLRMRLARMSRGSARCAHARAAHGLLPAAGAAAELARGCR
jgi:O-antigen ligase